MTGLPPPPRKSTVNRPDLMQGTLLAQKLKYDVRKMFGKSHANKDFLRNHSNKGSILNPSSSGPGMPGDGGIMRVQTSEGYPESMAS